LSYKYLLSLLTALLIINQVNSQVDSANIVKLELDGFSFIGSYDTALYCGNFTVISKEKTTIFNEECIEKVGSITAEDLDANGTREILVETYSGGAHCCTSLYIGALTGNSFKYIDTIYWGNCGYSVEDLNNDGKKEIIGCNDMFAYYFTNFADSRFPTVIYGFRNEHIKFINKEFTKIILKDIKEIKEELKDYLKKGFDCAKKVNGVYEVFNTDAGSVQALLAAIVASYQSIGEADEGYNYVDEVYNCPDKATFIKNLKTEFKLK